jgi:hypothetical protein
MKRAPRDPEPAKRWLAFLRNHREAIAAMDFFTVPTITFGVLYCFFVIAHDRRKILHFNVTRHPTSLWVVQQLREAFLFGSAPRFLIFDGDGKYGLEVPVASVGSKAADEKTLPALQNMRYDWDSEHGNRFPQVSRAFHSEDRSSRVILFVPALFSGRRTCIIVHGVVRIPVLVCSMQ